MIKAFGLLLVGAFVTANAISERCGSKCDALFSEETHQGIQNEPCKRGCRLYSIHDATRSVDPLFSFDLKKIGWNSPKDKPFNRCSKDCSDAYEGKTNEIVSACIQGCKNQQEVDIEPQTGIDDGFKDGFTLSFGRPGLFDFNTNIFDDLDRMIARTRSNVPSFLSFSRGDNEVDRKKAVEADQQGSSPFHSMFDSVHSNVQNLMQNVLGKFNQHMTEQFNTNLNDHTTKEEIKVDGHDVYTESNEAGQKLGGGGKLVVIKDGPGYHQEKTYNFGPNADVGKIFNNQMNDMMQHNNPLENFLKNDDVETIDPFKLTNQNEKDKEENRKETLKDNRAFDIQVLGPFISDGLKVAPEKSREDNIFGLNFGDLTLEPKLPETGLRSRPLPVFTGYDEPNNNMARMNIIVGDRSYEDVCLQDARQMKWSDWMSCLHTRLGLPQWLMAATVCLGIIFTLWICLVIPTNAPKQKVKQSKKSVGTKELEANSLENPHLAVIAVQKAYPLDLPPSYDDVTQTKVNLELVDEKPTINLEDSEAVALPEKTTMPNESQA